MSMIKTLGVDVFAVDAVPGPDVPVVGYSLAVLLQLFAWRPLCI